MLSCESCGIFVVKTNLILSKQLVKHQLQLQRSMLEGRAFDVINLASEDMPEP